MSSRIREAVTDNGGMLKQLVHAPECDRALILKCELLGHHSRSEEDASLGCQEVTITRPTVRVGVVFCKGKYKTMC